MPSRAPSCAWIAACVLFASAQAEAQERSAQDIVEAVLRDGPRAAAIRAEADVVRKEQAARLALPNPSLSYSREGAGFTDFLQVEQALPFFGVRRQLARAGASATAAAEAERDARLWQLRFEAAGAVSRLQAAQLRRAAVADDLAAGERVLRLVRIREDEGEGSRFDRLRVEQEVAELRHGAAAADVALSEARGALSALLPPGVRVAAVAGPLVVDRDAPPVQDLQARATQARAEWRGLDSAGERADREGRAARAARFPTPSVTAGLKRADGDAGRERGAIAGIALTVPVFDSGARDVARWSAERGRIDAARAALAQRVTAEVQAASEAMARRREALLSAARESRGEELLAAAQVAYREGDIGILAWLDALRVAARANVRNIEIQLDARLAQIALEDAVGEELWR
jgi:cobalt-zinc-cadmium efflux system outer membrane protein